MDNLSAIILAAGEGKRMKSKYSKVIHKIYGKPMIERVWDSVKTAGIGECIVIVGHRAEDVKNCMGDRVKYAVQEKQLGTGHAVAQAEKAFDKLEGYTVVLCGDTPLIGSQTIKDAIDFHINKGYSATVITAEMDDPTGYGRIIRDIKGDVVKIVEHKDASNEEKLIKEINSGMYCFTTEHLFSALKQINNNNSQGEYYLTDTLEILIEKGLSVGAIKVSDSDEILGINSRAQLAEAHVIMNKKVIGRLLTDGVTIIDPNNTYVSVDAKVGRDTIIYPGTVIEGNTVIGEDCIIGPNTKILDSNIDNGTKVENSVVLQSKIGKNSCVGPFAYLRPNSSVGGDVKIGDFVEIKNSTVGDGTKISHLTYVGDAEVGKNVNLGCGTVIVNYDGKEKHKTTIEDNVFVGCNSNLISPVTLKENCYIAAGSTITDEVPKNSLAIARSRQENKIDWVLKRRK